MKNLFKPIINEQNFYNLNYDDILPGRYTIN